MTIKKAFLLTISLATGLAAYAVSLPSEGFYYNVANAAGADVSYTGSSDFLDYSSSVYDASTTVYGYAAEQSADEGISLAASTECQAAVDACVVSAVEAASAFSGWMSNNPRTAAYAFYDANGKLDQGLGMQLFNTYQLFAKMQSCAATYLDKGTCTNEDMTSENPLFNGYAYPVWNRAFASAYSDAGGGVPLGGPIDTSFLFLAALALSYLGITYLRSRKTKLTPVA